MSARAAAKRFKIAVDAGVSAVGMIPWVGDLAKLGRLQKIPEAAREGLQLALGDARAAAILRPGMETLGRIVHALPLDRLPGPMRGPLQAVRDELDQGLASLRQATGNPGIAVMVMVAAVSPGARTRTTRARGCG